MRKTLTLLALALVVTGCGKDDSDTDDTQVVDDTPPVITLAGDTAMTLEVGDTFTDPGATATDDVDGEVDVTASGSVDTSTLGDYDLYYDAVDSSGNEADTVTRTVSVADTQAPVISLNGDDPMVVSQGDTFVDPGASVSDNYDTDLTATVSGTVDTTTLGTYTLTYDAVDSSGNTAASVERTVEVQFGGQLAVAADGVDLVLVGLADDGSLTELDRASLSGEILHYNRNHTIFGITRVPSTQTLYVSSMNECGALPGDQDGCWGNARIDRFTYDASSLTWEGLAYLAQPHLRLTDPTYDGTADTVTVTLLNQGDVVVNVTTATADSAFTTTCDGAALMSGDSCTLTADGASSLEDTLVDVDTDLGAFQWYFAEETEGWFTYENSINYDDPDAWPTCLTESSGTVHQAGWCALTDLVVSEDGARMYVNEDASDVALAFAVNADGTLTFLAESEDEVSYQGIEVSRTGDMVYNGSRAYSVTGDTFTLTGDNSGGNATEIVDHDGTEYLVSCIGNNELSVFDLTNPQTPSGLVDYTPSGRAIFQHHSADGALFAVIGRSEIGTVAFDGSALTGLSTADVTLEAEPCTDCDYNGYLRSVQVTGDGSMALTSAFFNAWDMETVAAIPFQGLLTSYGIDPSTGALTEISSLELDGMSRRVLFVPTP